MKCIVLAAGKGKRLQSEKFNKPKVLRKLNNKTLIEYVMDTINFIPDKDIVIVVGFMGEKVIETLGDNYNYVWQKQQLGTAHAVKMAEKFYINEDYVLVILGDMPFIKKETIRKLINQHKKKNNDITILTAHVSLPSSFGRIIRDKKNNIIKIIEAKDATEEQLKINEVNSGIAIYNVETLKYIDEIKNINAQNEYYLTDLIEIAYNKGKKIDSLVIDDEIELTGINTLEDLKKAEKLLNKF